MKKYERLEKIEKIAKEKKIITLPIISEELKVSESTLRRDLKYFEQKGLIEHSNGGFTWKDNRKNFLENIEFREKQHRKEKQMIGKLAARYIVDGDFVFIESGTTLLEVAKNISSDVAATIVTNDISIANELMVKPNLTIIVLGGVFWYGTNILIGEMTEKNLENMHFSKFFISPGGINSNGDLMFFNMQTSKVRQMGIDLSDKLFVVADNSKFGKNGFVKVGSLNIVDYLISDTVPDHFISKIPENVKIITSEN